MLRTYWGALFSFPRGKLNAASSKSAPVQSRIRGGEIKHMNSEGGKDQGGKDEERFRYLFCNGLPSPIN